MNKKLKHGWLVTLIFSVISLLYLYPIILVVINSFKKKAYISRVPFDLPKDNMFVGLENYIRGIEQTKFFEAFGWSLFITVGGVAVIILCCSMCAWFISRVNTWWTKLIYMLCLFAMVVPFQMEMYTLSKIANMLRLNTPWGLIFIYLGFGAGLAVFMFTGFMKSIPLEIEEAAMIDGCTPIQTFFKVVLPISKPTCITVMILQAMWIWRLSASVSGAGYEEIPDDSDRSTVFKRWIWICGYGSHDGSAGTFYHPDCNLLSVLPKTYYRRCRGRSCERIRLVRKKGMD